MNFASERGTTSLTKLFPKRFRDRCQSLYRSLVPRRCSNILPIGKEERFDYPYRRIFFSRASVRRRGRHIINFRRRKIRARIERSKPRTDRARRDRSITFDRDRISLLAF